MRTVFLSVWWFFHCWKSVLMAQTLHQTPYGDANWSQFNQGRLMRSGRLLREARCSVCGRLIWTSNDSPICNQLKCFIQHKGGRSGQETHLAHALPGQEKDSVRPAIAQRGNNQLLGQDNMQALQDRQEELHQEARQ